MSTSPYTLDLREKVISYLKKGHSQRSCAEVFSLHLSTVKRWWNRYMTEGHFKPRKRLGSKGKVDPQALLEYVKSHPEQTLKQIGAHFNVTDVAIFQRLRKLGYSYKKKAFTYAEANEEKRQAYEDLTKDISEEDLVYVDESGIEEGSCKEYAWSKIGQPIQGKRSGKTYQRLNIIGALNQGKCLAPFTFYGSCNTDIFNLWLEKVLVPELTPGQVVVLDNASFHKSNKTREIIEGAGCHLIFLPPYSPDFNPIEKFWAKMKKWVRNMIHIFENLYQTLIHFFGI